MEQKNNEQRTIKQNDSLHLYFEMLAESLNNAGLDVRAVMKPDVDITWSSIMVKELLWRPIQKIYIGQKSTTRLNKKQVSEVYEILNRHLAEKFGLFCEFPSIESLINYNDN